MSWSVPTYSGTYMGGSPNNVRTAMFELCRGVNERQAALSITKTQFRKATGTLATDITMSDLLGMFATGSNAKENLTRIRDAIISMANSGKFTTTSGGTTVWTKAAMESALGTDLDADPLRLQEARYWQAMQDALDLLIYGKIDITGPSTYTGASSRRTATSFVSKGAAWSAALVATPSSNTLAFAQWSNGPASSPFTATIYASANAQYDLSNYAGDIVAGEHLVQVINGSDIDIDWAVGTTSGTLAQNAAGGGTTHNAWEYWTYGYSTGGVLYIPVQITTAEPALTPFVTLSSSITVTSIRTIFYIDLASALADQA